MSAGIITILAGATGAALIKLIDGVIQWFLAQKEKKADKTEQEQTESERKLIALQSGMMAIMLDRIQYLCKAYIKDGRVDYDDRRRLHIMHDIYHNALGGNGDLDILMADVDDLPLKEAAIYTQKEK